MRHVDHQPSRICFAELRLSQDAFLLSSIIPNTWLCCLFPTMTTVLSYLVGFLLLWFCTATVCSCALLMELIVTGSSPTQSLLCSSHLSCLPPVQ